MDKTSKNKIKKEILLANPRGFCAGVERAIEIVEKSLEKYDCPVFVRHHVVHNKKVVENLESKGVTFVKEVDEIPDESIAIFKAVIDFSLPTKSGMTMLGNTTTSLNEIPGRLAISCFLISISSFFVRINK